MIATNDGGANWVIQDTPASLSEGYGLERFNDVSCWDRRNCAAVSGGRIGTTPFSRIILTRDGGDTWTVANTHASEAHAVALSSPCTGSAFGDDGRAASTIDGMVWTERVTASNSRLMGTDFVDTLSGYVVGSASHAAKGGTILATIDGGVTWVPRSVSPAILEDPKAIDVFELARPGGQVWADVSLADAKNGLVVGVDGLAAILTSEGGDWVLEATGSDLDLFGAAFPSPTAAFAVGAEGRILKRNAPAALPATARTSLPPACAPFDVTPTELPPSPVEPPPIVAPSPSPATQVVWVNSPLDEGGLGAQEAQAKCTATSPNSGSGQCTLRRALEVANNSDGAQIKFDHQVFRSSPEPTTILVDPVSGGSEDAGHFSITANDVVVDAEPDCDMNGTVAPCAARAVETEHLASLRPRVWIRVPTPSPDPLSDGCRVTFSADCNLGRNGVFQVGKPSAPVTNSRVRGLLISGVRTLRGAIEINGSANRADQNVIADASTGVFIADSGGVGAHVVADNYIGPVPSLELVGNRIGVSVTGAGNWIGLPRHGNLISESRNLGVNLTTSSGAVFGGEFTTSIRSNVVMGNRVLGPGTIGVFEMGISNTIGGAGIGEGNVISRHDYQGMNLGGLAVTVQGNEVSDNGGHGIDLAGIGDKKAPARFARIGGRAGAANRIMRNVGRGVATTAGSRNTIVENLFADNQAGAIDGPAPAAIDLVATPSAVTGLAPPGTSVEVYAVDGVAPIGRGVTAGNGRFLVAINDVAPGGAVMVAVTDRDGTTSGFSAAVDVAPSQSTVTTAPPAAPQAVAAAPAPGSIELSWRPVSAATGYEIYRSTSASFLPSPETFQCRSTNGQCDPITATGFHDGPLPRNVAYSYKVVAYDGRGQRSGPSNAVTATPTSSGTLLELVVNQSDETCPRGDGCLSLWGALDRARRAPRGDAGLRAVVRFDPSVFRSESGPTTLDGCCLNLGAGGVVIDGGGRVALQSAAANGPLGAVLGLDVDPAGYVLPSDDNVITGMRFAGFGPAVSVNGLRNTIGQPGAGNEFEGNEVAVDVLGSHNVVAGNRMAGQVFRTASAFASGAGVVVGGRANRVEDNVVVGGAGAGVRLVGGTDNEVVGNFIGLERDGAAAANQGPGVAADLSASGDVVKTNTIAHNLGPGVQMGPLLPAPLELARNSIFANGGTGIDISGASTSCDGGIPNAPQLKQVDSTAGTASGTACPGSRVEVFGAAPDPSGAGEGKTFLAAATAGSNGAFSVSGLTLRGEEALTATAMRAGATSAFAPNIAVPDIFAPGPVSGLRAAQRDPSSVELSWGAAADDAGTTRPAQRYQVRQSTSPIETVGFDADGVARLCEGDCFTGTLGAAGDPVRFTVTDLLPGVSYHWAVRAVDSAGLVGPIATVSLALDDLAPASVSDLTARGVSGSEIELTFSAPGANGNGPPAARGYLIRQSSSSIDTPASFENAKALCGGICRFAPGQVGERLTLSVTRLRPNTTYHYAVVAVDDAGLRSPLSNPASATTSDSPACPAAGSPGAGEIAYPHGYSLVGLPDGNRLPADSPLYGWFDLGDGGSYSVQEPTDPVTAGRGYWAWFSCPRLITPAAGTTTTLQFPLGDYHASMVGNPSASDNTRVTGHDFAARWDSSLNGGVGGYLVSGYRQPESLAPGAGAWVFSYRDTTIQLGP